MTQDRLLWIAAALATAATCWPELAAAQYASTETRPPVVVPPSNGQKKGSALERTLREWEVKKEKMELHLRPAMRRHGIDMWILMSREFHPDPVLDLFGGHGISGWYGHRNAYIFRDPGGDLPLEGVILGTHQSDYMRRFFARIEGYGEEGLEPHLREYVQQADPARIAINRSRTVAMADGITAEMLAYLEEAIGPEYSSRLVSSEPLVIDYVSRRTSRGAGNRDRSKLAYVEHPPSGLLQRGHHTGSHPLDGGLGMDCRRMEVPAPGLQLPARADRLPAG